MEFKYLVILTVLGVAAGFSVPPPPVEQTVQKEIASPVDLEDSFAKGQTGDVDLPSNQPRDKRHLFFKKNKKYQSGRETVYVERPAYEAYRPGREVHHHHHYNNYRQEQPVYQTYQAPAQDYHHYHGYQQQQQQYGWSSAGTGSYSRPNYGDGGYAHYGQQTQPQQQAPVTAVPLSSGHNHVDRGQGAAAVNNIAIIHARAGSSTNLAASETNVLPSTLPINVGDALNMFDH